MSEEISGASWYVVHTYSGYENKVKANIEKTIENRHLEDQILEVSVPLQDAVEIKNGVKKQVQKKIFPGYVLIHMILNDDTWYVVRNTRGVTGFVGPASKPVPLTEQEALTLGVGTTTKLSTDICEGDQVKIKGGSLNGYSGEVKSVDLETGMAIVFVFMFGRKMNVEVEINQLEKC